MRESDKGEHLCFMYCCEEHIKNETKYEMFHDIHKGDTIKRGEAKFFEEMRQDV